MKLKKLLTSLVVLAASFSSLSALSIGGKYIGDFEVGVNQGFPIEWSKADGDNFSPVFYTDQSKGKIFVTSTGFDLLWSWHKSIGASLTFDWGYTNINSGMGYSILDGRDANFKAYGTTFYFKIGPAFQFGNDKVTLQLTPGFVISKISMTRQESYPNTFDTIKIKYNFGFPFGLGVGTKLKFNLNSFISLNAGVDLDFMLANSDAKVSLSSNSGQSITQSISYPHQVILNLMPKIGVTARF